MRYCCCWDTLCITSLISLHCGFPLEEDLGSSSLFTISELRSVQHQKAAMALNTARRVPGRVGDCCSPWRWHYYCSLVRSPSDDRQPCKWAHAITLNQTTVPPWNAIHIHKPWDHASVTFTLFVLLCLSLFEKRRGVFMNMSPLLLQKCKQS